MSRDRTFSNTVYFIGSDSKFLLGLLNSKLLWFVIRGLSNALRGGLWRFRLFSGHIERLPMPQDVNRDRHDRMVSLVERMLELHKQLASREAITQKEISTARSKRLMRRSISWFTSFTA